MGFLEIFTDLEKKYKFDLVVIQGTEETYYCYGKGLAKLNHELNLRQPIENNHSIKISSSHINEIENHLKDFKYVYLILELSIDHDEEFTKYKFTVTKSSIDKAIGDSYDNRNKSGNYPKKRKKLIEKIIDLTSINPQDTSKNFELTEEQKETLKKINDWINSSNPIAILGGRAGSGKTTLLKFVIELLNKRKKTFTLLAPTGRAARILGKKTNHDAHTIHSEIYEVDFDKIKMSNDNNEQQLSFEESDFALNFKIKAQETLSQIYIIDESSMIGDEKTSDGDMNFGSGRVLHDLLIQIGVIHRKNSDAKILFVGDRMQLPPVREDNSFALYPNHLFERFSLEQEPEFFELKNVLRQTKNSLVLENAEALRKKIIDDEGATINIKIDNKVIKRTNFLSLKKTSIENDNFNKKIVVTRSNKTAYGYNKSIRSDRFGENNSRDLMVKDQIIVTHNSPFYGCFNGDIFTVIEIKNSKIVSTELSKADIYKNNPKKIDLRFKKVIVRHIEHDDEKFNKEIIILENLLFKPDAFIDREEQIALHVDWNNRIREMNLSAEEKKRNLLNDPYLNAVKVKFAYAITCHRAQGGEWDDVTVYLDDIRYTKEYLRWLYTSITRTTNQLSFINLNTGYCEI